MQKIVSFEDLANADLIVDTLYKGGDKDNASDDPISKLLKCCNRCGFRYAEPLIRLKWIMWFCILL